MTRYERCAAKAIAAVLIGRQDPTPLYSLTCVADTAARQCGKRRDLYPSLYDYEKLIPPSWKCRWLTAAGGSGDSMLMVVPPEWAPGTVQNRELILGRGLLVAAERL
jgi:hypothetical protein